MIRALLTLLMLLGSVTEVCADGGHDHHAIPTMPSLGNTKITIDEHTVSLTFGPVDLPTVTTAIWPPACRKKCFSCRKTPT